jgi:hypothetical protein
MILPHSITLQKHTENESSLGGVSKSYAADSVSYRAFVQPQRESLAIINTSGGRNLIVDIYAEPTIPAAATDRIVFDGQTYEITGAIQQFSPRGNHHVKITARVLDFIS